MSKLHSLSMLTAPPGALLLKWVTSPCYRAVMRPNGIVHLRYMVHSIEELERFVSMMKPDTQAALRKTPEYQGAVRYICPDEKRPGRML